MILNGVKDHIVPHIAKKGTTKKMWHAIVKLYQDPSKNKKLILKEKLRTIKQEKGENMTSYLTRVWSIKDELATI